MKLLSIILSLAVLTTACSKTVKEVHETNPPLESKKSEQLSENKNSLSQIRLILNSGAPNLALAELLARAASATEKKAIQDIILDLSPEEINKVISQVRSDSKSIHSQYLFHGMNYQANKEFLRNSLLEMDNRVSDILPLEDQIKISVFTYVKNKTLDDIVKTYSNRVDLLSQELAQQIAFEVGTEFPSTAKEIENAVKNGGKESGINAISNAGPVLKKIDKYFNESGLNENEQYTVVGSGLVIGAIYMAVKDSDGFQKLIDGGKRIEDVKKLIVKAKELNALAYSLKKHFKDSEEHAKLLKEGIEGSRADFREMAEVARSSLGNSSNVHSKRIMNFLYTKVIKGKDIESANTDPSIISKQIRINTNVNKTITAVGNIAGNLSNILDTTEKMMVLFKMKPSKDLQKAIRTAKTIADTVTTVRNVTAGFAAAGPLGAFAALSSSPALSSVLGGGDNNAAEFKMINMKLNMILDNQKKIMEAQIETMKMIKDLALMVDQHHQKEMRALSELRDLSLVNLEINKTLLNKDIRSCERMINFQLSSVWKELDFKMNSFYGINDLKIINSRFQGNIHGLHDIRRIVNSVEANGFEKCQNGIVEAFGGNSVTENPLRSLFSSSEHENLVSFQRNTYHPLLSLLYFFAETTELNSIPLHIPSANYDGLMEKVNYLLSAKTENDGAERHYDLEDLVSTKGLERYLSQLLILHPFLEVDKNVWGKDLKTIVNTYLTNSNSGSNQNIRSYYLLSNALKLVQSAIAQETILAGEPLLLKLHDVYFDLLVSKENCDQVPLGNLENSCAIRKNKLLMKNLLIFKTSFKLRHHYGDYFNEYEKAYSSGNLEALAKLISLKLDGSRFVSNAFDGLKVHSLILKDEEGKDIKIRLPLPASVKNGNLMYSENMDHLLLMQKAIVENLEKIAPMRRNNRDDDLSKIMMMKLI